MKQFRLKTRKGNMEVKYKRTCIAPALLKDRVINGTETLHQTQMRMAIREALLKAIEERSEDETIK